MKPVASGSYYYHKFWKFSNSRGYITASYSLRDSKNPSNTMAINKFNIIIGIKKINEMKYGYDNQLPHSFGPFCI